MEESIFEWMEQVRLVDRVLFALALAGPPIVATTVAILRRRPVVTMFRDRWVMSALSMPALFIMWVVYNAIVDRWGLDSVAGLGVNVLVFAAAAMAAVGLKLWLEKRLRMTDQRPPRGDTTHIDLPRS